MRPSNLLKWLVFAISCLILLTVQGQSLNYISSLAPAVAESSGLIELEGHLITHNDSGDEPYLYIINPDDGSVIHSVFIAGALHVDWEDITHDADFIYIGDIGNNEGSRQDLAIYKVPLAEAWTQDTISAERIDYYYADQTSFEPSTFTSNYDAEALLSYGDSLYIFTKNWANAKCNIYSCPKSPGIYALNRLDSIDSQGFITGATYNASQDEILLCGYTFGQAFIIRVTDINLGELSESSVTRTEVEPMNSSYQIEAITDRLDGSYMLSSEANFSGAATLQSLVLDTVLGLPTFNQIDASIFPNPSDEQVSVHHAALSYTEIYTANGEFIKSSAHTDISTSDLAPGVYLLILRGDTGEVLGSFKLMIE